MSNRSSRTAWCRLGALCAAMVGTSTLATTARAADVWSQRPVTETALGSCVAPGSISLAGTGGCLRVGGSLAADFGTALPGWRGSLSNTAGVDRLPVGGGLDRPTTQARLSADVRLPTALGDIRAYVSVRSRRTP